MYVVCGEALFDFFLSRSDGPGKLTFEARAGGSPFNVAIGIVRQGGEAALLTGISDDMLGARLASLLESERVDTSYLVRSGRRTTLSLVALAPDGQPEYAFYGLGSADCSLEAHDLPDLSEPITGLHFGSYSIVVDPVADAFAKLAEQERDRFISLDPNVRPTVVPDREVWKRNITRLLPCANLVKVSAEDLAFLYPDVRHEQIAEQWLAAGPSLVIVTDGGRSVRAFRTEGTCSVMPAPTEVIDTVGAGDAFQASLLAHLARLGDPATVVRSASSDVIRDVLATASTVAAETCRRRGADIPHRK